MSFKVSQFFSYRKNINLTYIFVFQPIDNRRDEFRRYLERTGLIDALNKVLVNLFHENEKPENTVDYLCSNIGDVRADKDTIEALKAELVAARMEIELLKKNLPTSDIKPIEEVSLAKTIIAESVIETTAADSSSSTNTEASEESVIEKPLEEKEAIIENIIEPDVVIESQKTETIEIVDVESSNEEIPSTAEIVIDGENTVNDENKVNSDEPAKDPPIPE